MKNRNTTRPKGLKTSSASVRTGIKAGGRTVTDGR